MKNYYSIEELRAAAKKKLPGILFDFFDGGAEDEVTLKNNRQDFQRVTLRPRVLRNVAAVDSAAHWFGAPVNFPAAIGPTGVVGFGRRHGELMLARAAADAGIPFTLSTASTSTIEQVADQAQGRLWFQAYILQDKERLHQLIDRAVSANYEALVITVDLPVGGKRERDLRNGLQFPMRFNAHTVGQFMRAPAWSLDMLIRGVPALPHLQGLRELAVDKKKMEGVAGKNYDPSFDLEGLKSIRDRWPRKLIVKGVVHPADVPDILSVGADAIVVSNHGGRQLDTGISTIRALPSIVEAAAGQVPVFLDGGVYRGSDIFKVIALGSGVRRFSGCSLMVMTVPGRRCTYCRMKCSVPCDCAERRRSRKSTPLSWIRSTRTAS
jgi:(S)-mandelate dehydrogenase